MGDDRDLGRRPNPKMGLDADLAEPSSSDRSDVCGPTASGHRSAPAPSISLSQISLSQKETIKKLRDQIHAIDSESDRSVAPFSGAQVTLGNADDGNTSHWLESGGEDLFLESQQESIEPEFGEAEIQLDPDALKTDALKTGASESTQSSTISEDRLSEDQVEEGFPVGSGQQENAEPATIDFLPYQQKKREIISTGNAVWDSWFPDNGISTGTIIQWLAPSAGGGGLHLIFDIAKRICGDHGLFVIIDPKKWIYPGTLQAIGFDLSKVLFVHPEEEAEHLWAWEQCLSNPAVSAVWTSLDHIDGRYQRRWQLAARKGRAVGLLSRPDHMAKFPAWSDAQFLLNPIPSKSLKKGEEEDLVLEIEAIRCRGLFGKPKLRLTLKNEILQSEGRGGSKFIPDVMNRTFGN